MSLPVGWHPQAETINGAIYTAANQAMRRYHDYVEREDVWQECLAWVIDHPRTVNEMLLDNQLALARALENEALRYAMKEKAARCGYEVEDLYFWQKAAIEGVLPSLFNSDDWTDKPERFRSDTPSQGDPSVGGNWQAGLIDISRAYEALGERDQAIIRMYYHEGLTQEQIGWYFDIAQGTVSTHINRAIRKMHRSLGGFRPREHDAETCEECTGTRKVMSNAAAAAMTERNEDGE